MLGRVREFDVKEIKTDERTDLAVLRIEPNESLPAAPLGDSDRLEIGDWVLARPFEPGAVPPRTRCLRQSGNCDDRVPGFRFEGLPGATAADRA